MIGHPESGVSDLHRTYVSKNRVKFLRDIWSVLEMKTLFLVRGWYWYLIRALMFPIGVLFWLRVMVPDEPDINLRVLAGAVILGVSLATANLVSQQVLQDKFLGRLNLLATMPMSKASYGAGVMLFSTLQSTPIVVVLMVLAPVIGVNLELSWTFFPLIVAAVIGISGIALLISSYAPSLEVGGIMANFFGVVLVMASPVFFTMDQAPPVLRLVGWVSPMRYAADGITKSISGDHDIWVELTVLTTFAAAAMAIGLWKLTWREV